MVRASGAFHLCAGVISSLFYPCTEKQHTLELSQLALQLVFASQGRKAFCGY